MHVINKIKNIFLRYIILAVFLLSASFLAAQSPFSAAYRVNSSVISHYDIDQMAELMVMLGRDEKSARQDAIELLIHDRLLKQELTKFNFELEPVLIARSLDRLGGGEPGDGAKIRADLNQKGIVDSTIDTYVASQILLRSYMDTRGIEYTIRDEEIASRIMSIPDQHSQVVTIAEMVLPYAEYGGRIPTRLKLSEIEAALQNGESFEGIARQISRSPTAVNGGRIGPIPVEGLNAQLSGILASVGGNGLAKPIETEGAIILIKLVGYSQVTHSLPRTPTVSYIDLFIPAKPDLASSLAKARSMARNIHSCDQAEVHLKGKGKYDNAPVNSLSSGISLALARIEAGGNTILERENGTSVLFLCKREVIVPENIATGVQNRVRGEAADARAAGVLQELRNTANIVKVE